MHDYIAQHGITAVMSCHANPTYVPISCKNFPSHSTHTHCIPFHLHLSLSHSDSSHLFPHASHHFPLIFFVLHTLQNPPPRFTPLSIPSLHIPHTSSPPHTTHKPSPPSHNSQTFPSLTQLTNLPLPHTTHTSSPPHTFHPFPWYPLTNNSTIPSNGMHSLTYLPGDTQRGLSIIEGDPSHHVNGSRGGCNVGSYVGGKEHSMLHAHGF